MKRHPAIGAALLLALAAISASAQTPAPGATTPKPAAPQTTPVAAVPVPATKIALVDTVEFADEKTGIRRYVNAVSSVQLSFKARTDDLLNLQNRIKLIADEIAKLTTGNSVVGQQSIQAKRDEAEALEREFKYKKEQLDADYEKKFNEVVSPVSRDIGKGLDQYATQYGLTMIIDISKLAPAVLSVNPATDITRAFIADYNSKNP